MQIIWRTSAILLIVAISANAQAPKVPVVPAVNTGSAQILPVSLTNEQVAATVNGEKILIGEVRKILDQRPYPDVLKEEQKKQLRQAALEVIIEDVIVRQYLTKHVPKVTQEDYTREWQALEASLVRDKKTLDTFLAETGQTKEQLQRDVVAKLQWKTYLARVYPDDKLKGYYETNKPFFDKVFVQASHILIKLPANPTKEQRDTLVQQMLVLRQEIATGKMTFEDAAKKYSHCPSKDNKGDIGQFPLKFVVLPEFGKAAFALKVGEISEPIQTISGLHLIKVTDRTKGEPSEFEKMKEAVREAWATEDELYNRVLAEQKKAGEIKILMP